MSSHEQLKSGAIALVGSGEYTPAMNETDRFLLGTLGGSDGIPAWRAQPVAGADTGARVAVIPTASALEPGAPERWNRMGVEHFGALGAQVAPLMLLTRSDAVESQIAAELRDADLYYFSGGDPQYLVETLRDTPAWDTIRTGHAAGAVIAGCSAGAMMLGGYALGIRALSSGLPLQWLPALGLLPRVAVMPHFDRVAEFVGEELFRAIIRSAPAGVTLVGVDEDTALVYVPAMGWRVIGRQTVSIFDDNGTRTIYRAGDPISLNNEHP